MLDFSQIDRQWTLFLDRDGVINVRLPGQYVCKWEEFTFMPGALEAIAAFSKLFNRIVVVTNQQGIGKQLMTTDDLENIHRRMLSEIEQAGGRIDAVYFCPALREENHPCRKPNPGMAFEAKSQFPEIDFSRSLIVGDSVSDMEFGAQLGMRTVFVKTKKGEGRRAEQLQPSIDLWVNDLPDFAKKLSKGGVNGL